MQCTLYHRHTPHFITQPRLPSRTTPLPRSSCFRIAAWHASTSCSPGTMTGFTRALQFSPSLSPHGMSGHLTSPESTCTTCWCMEDLHRHALHRAHFPGLSNSPPSFPMTWLIMVKPSSGGSLPAPSRQDTAVTATALTPHKCIICWRAHGDDDSRRIPMLERTFAPRCSGS